MNTRPIAAFFRVASLLMLLVAVALMAAIVTMHFAIHGAEVQVPALKEYDRSRCPQRDRRPGIESGCR